MSGLEFGIDGVRMLSNVGGLPALFVVLGLQVCLIRMMFQATNLDQTRELLAVT